MKINKFFQKRTREESFEAQEEEAIKLQKAKPKESGNTSFTIPTDKERERKRVEQHREYLKAKKKYEDDRQTMQDKWNAVVAAVVARATIIVGSGERELSAMRVSPYCVGGLGFVFKTFQRQKTLCR